MDKAGGSRRTELSRGKEEAAVRPIRPTAANGTRSSLGGDYGVRGERNPGIQSQ